MRYLALVLLLTGCGPLVDLTSDSGKVVDAGFPTERQPCSGAEIATTICNGPVAFVCEPMDDGSSFWFHNGPCQPAEVK